MKDWQIIRRYKLRVYAFDVDETLEISNGPVTLKMLQELRDQGHIIGICGNWAGFCHCVHGWWNLVSFINAGTPNKESHLADLKRWIPADDFIMVGNVFGRVNSLGVKCGSYDDVAARAAGWRFILEDDFAKGVR